MSDILSTLLIVGFVGLAISNRCDWFQICDGLIPRSEPAAPAPAVAAEEEPLPSSVPSTVVNTGSGKSGSRSYIPFAGGSCGPSIYKPTGNIGKLEDTGEGGELIHYNTIKNIQTGSTAAQSRRINAEGVPFDAIEATAYFTFDSTHKNCAKPHVPFLIKLWGPHHQPGSCCWCMMSVLESGEVCLGKEGPHPETLTCEKTLANVGSLSGRLVGIKGVIWPVASGAHQELWLDIGTGWKFMGSQEGTCGYRITSTKMAAGQEVQFRIDCTGIKVKCADVVEIVPGVKNGGGATTDVTNTPPPSSSYTRIQRIAI